MAPKRRAASKKNASKRLKTDPNEALNEAARSNPNSSECLIAEKLFGTDVVSVIFSFLEVRQLLRFVCVSKEFKSLLTYDHVIRATMLSGGFPMTSLERMIPPIRNRKIWIPSPLRLLRTVCGKRCEECNAKTRFVCESFGVFLCNKCLDKSTKLLRRSKRWTPYLQANRVCLGPRKGSTRYSSSYLMTAPQTEKNGDSIGPLVTCQDIENMDAEQHDSIAPPTPAERVAAFIRLQHQPQPQAADAAVKSILQAIEDNRQDAVNRRAAVQEEKEEARDRYGEARRKKSDDLMTSLIELLEQDNADADAVDTDIQEQVAKLKARQWSARQNQYTFYEDSIVRKLVMPVLRAPSKYASKKKLQQVANEIRLVTGEKRLTEMYIQQIVNYCQHPDADSKVLRRTYRTYGLRYGFANPAIRDILNKPLSKPRDLTEQDVQQLAVQVKQIAVRQEPGEALLLELESRLKEQPCAVQDLNNRSWNTWNWSWMFKETYIQDILYEPISKPQDVTDAILNELEQKLWSAMEKKKLIKERMELLLEPIAEPYPTWKTRLERWSWNSKTDTCTFWDYLGKRALGGKLQSVEEMDDSTIREMSNLLLAAIQERETSGFRF
eukprot:CAMPEP_0113615696 /NCGR_PEP_ID=MMETSP0017_2-20120614/7842_1 /TAXON_ID=2856 /ORGANISM="Cylindrotheca closterium" /LENGTH=608 /DNA_ID=CAMNT_0000524957 /DNA_START=27 /DNA_END=1853 /DNA_ORIENTATION=+ /assembly_acc=CAM_ASM_000147